MRTKKVVEQEKQGLEALKGKTITLFCTRYIYTGVLISVDETCCLLQQPKIVYDTGSWDKKEWLDAQSLPKKEWHVMLQSIESFGVAK